MQGLQQGPGSAEWGVGMGWGEKQVLKAREGAQLSLYMHWPPMLLHSGMAHTP
jgi:hypothetical protein